MAGIIEPLMKETLWSELESRGFSVYGEVTLPGSGQIDLYVITPNGNRWGIEVKNHWNMIAWSDRDRDLGTNVPDPSDTFTRNKLQKLANQLNRYRESGYCDMMYVATQGPEPLIASIKDENRGGFLFSKWDEEDPPDYVGAIRVPPFALGAVKRQQQLPYDFDTPREIKITHHPERLTDTRPSTATPDLPPSIGSIGDKIDLQRESDLAHVVWHSINENTPSPVLREPVIPRQDSKNPQNPDIMHFSGLANPSRVYNKNNPGIRYGNTESNSELSSEPSKKKNPPYFDVVAIEIKLDLSTKSQTAYQLRRYLNSGGLTQLYLCLPSNSVDEGKQFLSEYSDRLADVGLLVYRPDLNGLAAVRKASRRKLEYPYVELGTNNYGVCEVGWGLAWTAKNDMLLPVWDQRNMEARYVGPDPTDRDLSDLDWSDDALNADGYDDPDNSLTFVECTSCDSVVQVDITRELCPECNRPVIRRLTSPKVRKVGTDKYNNSVWTKITE